VPRLAYRFCQTAIEPVWPGTKERLPEIVSHGLGTMSFFAAGLPYGRSASGGLLACASMLARVARDTDRIMLLPGPGPLRRSRPGGHGVGQKIFRLERDSRALSETWRASEFARGSLLERPALMRGATHPTSGRKPLGDISGISV